MAATAPVAVAIIVVILAVVVAVLAAAVVVWHADNPLITLLRSANLYEQSAKSEIIMEKVLSV